jgi:hypothetical protein
VYSPGSQPSSTARRNLSGPGNRRTVSKPSNAACQFNSCVQTAYLDASDAFVALATADKRVPGGTAQNIIDEVGRARTLPALRDVVCVLKEASVGLPGNINPVWEVLEPDQPEAAFRVISRQLEAWGVVPTMPRPGSSATSALPAGFLTELLEGVELGDHTAAEARVRELFGKISKEDQRRVAQGIYDYIQTPPGHGIDVHIVTSFLEVCGRIDPALIDATWVEQLVESPIVQHRMSAAMILWDRSETDSGSVPLDLIVKLAKPSSEDWYVFAPALGAAKQLALTRRSALEIVLDLARSISPSDRDYAVRALKDLAVVDAATIPIEPVQRLAHDGDPSVAESATELLDILANVSDEDRRKRHGQFGL